MTQIVIDVPAGQWPGVTAALARRAAHWLGSAVLQHE